MAREFSKRFYKSKHWKNCRASYIAKRIAIDGGLCETCHDAPGFIVHHTVWLTPENINDPGVALNHNLLKYDCLICHNKEGTEVDEYPYAFDADGQLIPLCPP